jgi:hypothetical protein
MAVSVKAKFVLVPAAGAILVGERGTQAALNAIARTVMERMKANVTGPGTSAFKRRAFVERGDEPGTWHAGTRYRIAHIFEFGSVNTRPHGWLRNAAISTPSTRFVGDGSS